jgi:hypothetical protein
VNTCANSAAMIYVTILVVVNTMITALMFSWLVDKFKEQSSMEPPNASRS